ncbi:hypothetical protein CBL_11751, partial [Carabus blaptoides fortunei]
MEQGTNSKEIICQLDTGASCNVISRQTLQKVTGEKNARLKPSQVELKCFGGEILKPKGEHTDIAIEQQQPSTSKDVDLLKMLLLHHLSVLEYIGEPLHKSVYIICAAEITQLRRCTSFIVHGSIYLQTNMPNFLKRLDVPSSWTSQREEVYKKEIFSYNSEYARVVDLLDGIPKLNMKSVYRVQCPYLYHRYMLRKLEYKAKSIHYKKMQLLHVTDASNVESILKDNLDWRRVYRAKFGQGVSFSPSAAYANKECSRQNGSQRAVIVAKVLVGNTQYGYRNMELPESDYDTTTGDGNTAIAVFQDNLRTEAVLEHFDENPSSSVCRASAVLNIPRQTIWRTLKADGRRPYYNHKVQHLLPEDLPRRRTFCEWYTHQ